MHPIPKEAAAGIPVIALTGMALKEDQEKTHAAGCDAYFTKPWRCKELFDAIEALLIRDTSQRT